MPNHVENELMIRGSQEDVAACLALIGADQTPPRFDFNAVIPYPEVFQLLDDERHALEKEHGWSKAREIMIERHGGDGSDGYNSGGYEWCCQNWGTKWRAYEVARRDYGGVRLTFQTAWSPPLPVIAKLAELFPMLTLSLEYAECGAGYCGGVNYRGEDGEPSDSWESRAYLGMRGG